LRNILCVGSLDPRDCNHDSSIHDNALQENSGRYRIMEFANQAIFIGALLFLISIVATGFASKAGAPLLLVFLAVGMVAGEEGFNWVSFESFNAAYAVGSLALALILFDGGMRARAESSKIGIKPAISLATFGVLITTLIVAALLRFLLDLKWEQCLLIGAIVGSTDAAAVFSLLHSKGLHLKKRVGTTLEIESGCNDPMAIFLTLLLVETITRGSNLVSWWVVGNFIYQFGLGAILGWLGGRALVILIQRVHVTPGLYPLLAAAGGLTLFGFVSLLGASGFLAIYIAGVIVGNTALHASNNIRRVHDGLAWLAQISLFLILGLLVTPTTLASYWDIGLIVALILMFVARPLAVVLSLMPFSFPPKEKLFISWVGLRGAVPIVLAIFPVLGGVENADIYFNVAFVTVLLSLMVQGWSLVPLSKRLGLRLPVENIPYYTESLEVPGRSDLTVVGYRIADDSPVTGRRVDSLLAPEGVKFVAVFRDDYAISRVDSHMIRPGDLLYVICPQEKLFIVNQMLLPTNEVAELEQAEYFGDFTLHGDAVVGEVLDAYGGEVPEKARQMTLAQFMSVRFKNQVVPGDRIFIGSVELVAKDVDENGVVMQLGLRVRA